MFDETPVFRKIIVPWYDTDLACTVTLIFLVAVFLFACCGLSAALELTGGYIPFIGVPCFLLIISAAGIISITLRLIHRNRGGFKQ